MKAVIVSSALPSDQSSNAHGDFNASGHPEDRCMARDLAAELLQRARSM